MSTIENRIKPFLEIAGVGLLAVYAAYTIKMYHGQGTGAALPPQPPRREEQKQETTLELAL